MDMRQYGRSKTFITFEDVVDGPIQAKIVGCKIGNYDRPVLDLEGGKKFSLHKPNVDVLVATYGEDFRDWSGKQSSCMPAA